MRERLLPVWAMGLTALALGCLSVPAWSASGQSERCSGDPLVSLKTYQQAVKASQGWDDISFQTHLTQGARQRLLAARAKVDFSLNLGQGGPLQGWPAHLTLPERQATAQRQFLAQVAAWPLESAKLSPDAPGLKASFRWAVDDQRGVGDAAVATHASNAVTVTLRCEGAQWRVDQESWKRETLEVSMVKGAGVVPGSPFKEEWVWP